MNPSLTSFNTFGIQATAETIVVAESLTQLIDGWKNAQSQQHPVLILGEGSNVLFMDDFKGTVIINRIKGIEIIERNNDWLLHVNGGENWHQLVTFTLAQGIPGLENLALIPGCVGSAPIQNIGAYGVDLQQVCDYVDCIDLQSGKALRLTNDECHFGYRDSIFKQEAYKYYIITAVGLSLSKDWAPVLAYGDLAKLDPHTVTAKEIFDAVCQMRRMKLPDPKVNGNAGSFFKNPVIDNQLAHRLIEAFPDIPHYPQPDGSIKLAAGWLIDKCHLKGFQIGGAAVHRQQALVLINKDNATSHDVIALAKYIRQEVGKTFSVWLEPEVRFINSLGEVSAVEAIV